MPTQEQIQKLEKELEALRAQEAEQQTAEEFFLSKIAEINSIKIDKERYPVSVFFFRDTTLLFEIEERSGAAYLWINREDIWNTFETKYSMKDYEVEQFINSLVEEHFKLRAVTSMESAEWFILETEEHFKTKQK